MHKMNTLNASCTALVVLLLTVTAAMAQEGHPLDGTWSGDRIANGDKVRVLLIMKLLPDQRIEGTVIENGARIALHDITLDPENWSVTMTVDGATRAGEPVRYKVDGVIENLGSASERRIVGTWENGSDGGEFRVSMN